MTQNQRLTTNNALPIAVAPMMAYTDTYFRTLLSIINPQAILYTEMICAEAIIRKPDWREMLKAEARQNNLVIQIGGSCPMTLAQATQRINQVGGFTAINLNIGCPSPRVQAGRFGACLFMEPGLVAECVTAMQQVSDVPITVKTRLGVDDMDAYTDVVDFVRTVAGAGCQYFIMHARKAWLKGLNPAQNRSIPTLKYEWVGQLEQDFPDLTFMINGGIGYADLQANRHLTKGGVMLGRAIYNDPIGLNLSTHAMDAQQLMAYRSAVALEYLAHLSKLGYSQINRRSVMPLVLLAKGFKGARSLRATLVEQGGQGIKLAALAANLQSVLV